MHPCVCKAGRHAHSGPGHTGGCPDTKCRRYRADLAWDLAYRALDAQQVDLGRALREADREARAKHYKDNPREPGQWSIGASDTSTCPKKIEYRNRPPEGMVRAPEDSREALMGTMIHDGVTERMRALYPWRDFGGKVTIPGLDRESEFDSYDPIIGELEDYKTAGDWRWDQVGDHGPEEDVWEQAMLYALALISAGRMVKTVKITYIKRANGHDESFVRPYDEHMAKAALDRLLGYATALDLGIELPKTGKGPSLDPLCRRCFAREDCWNTEAAQIAGRSPESYTILGAEPDDPTIVWAIEKKIEASRLTSEAKNAADEAKVLLEGVTPGRYADYEGYITGGGSPPDWKAHAGLLATYYDLPEDERPPLASIPEPQPRKYTYIRWGRVRKATLAKEAKAAREGRLTEPEE